jgi:hypothetical protein
MADREGLFADATCLAARTRGLISAVGLHPFGADLQSVCAAERRSHPSDEKTDGEGLPALRSGRLAALGSNFVLIPGEVSSLPSAKVADGEGFEPLPLSEEKLLKTIKYTNHIQIVPPFGNVHSIPSLVSMGTLSQAGSVHSTSCFLTSTSKHVVAVPKPF